MAELTTSGQSGRSGSRTRQAPRIDLTAMVDLAFLLITFFICHFTGKTKSNGFSDAGRYQN